MSFKPDFSKDLVLDNKYYSEFLRDLFELMLKTDSYLENNSNNFLKGRNVSASVIAKSVGVLACNDELKFMIQEFTSLSISFSFKEGYEFSENDTLCTLEGDAFELLSVERVFMNLLTRACGIAYNANSFASSVETAEVLMTRKCLLSLFDKKAGSVGGVYTHRLNLDHAVMLKDNHQFLGGKPNVDSFKDVDFVEVEVSSADMIEDTLSWLKEIASVENKIIMFDNFTPDEVVRALKSFDFTGSYVEVSGGITLKNIAQYDVQGVDFISSSAISAQPYAVDLSLNLDKK